MRERTMILDDLVNLRGSLIDLQKELSEYPWDSEIPLITVRKNDFIIVLKKCIDNQTLFLKVGNWANAIECREDIDFEVEKIKEYIFELANPILNGEISKERLKEMVTELA
jgi:hypothetical protein